MNDFRVEPDEPITEQEIEDFYQLQGGGGGGFDDSLVEGLAHEDTEIQRMLLEKEAREEGLSKEESPNAIMPILTCV
jgi:hypothetical protein